MSLTDLNVLVVEDSPVVQKVAVKILRQCGISRVKTASEGAECLKLIDSEKFDVIMLDLNMPGMDGVELVSSVEPGAAFPAVIICSATDLKTMRSAREVAEYRGIEILGVLEKPYSAQSLGALLDRVGKNDVKRNSNAPPPLSADRIIDLLDQRMRLVFQPKIALETRLLCGVESLVRWEDEGGVLLPPMTFIPILERAGKIQTLTRLVLERSLAALAEWTKDGLETNISINVSADDVVARDFVAFATQAVTNAGIQPDRVTFELTETKIAADQGNMLATLTRLRMKGFGIAIDDFGCGASSLAQLRQGPFSELKIDKQFVAGLSSDSQNLAIVESCVAMGRKLGLKVVAEGVETQEELNELQRVGCDAVQGYLLGKPMTSERFTNWFVDSMSMAS